MIQGPKYYNYITVLLLKTSDYSIDYPGYGSTGGEFYDLMASRVCPPSLLVARRASYRLAFWTCIFLTASLIPQLYLFDSLFVHANDILVLQATENTWINVNPENLAAPSRVLHTSVLLGMRNSINSSQIQDVIVIYGGFGSNVDNDVVSLS